MDQNKLKHKIREQGLAVSTAYYSYLDEKRKLGRLTQTLQDRCAHEWVLDRSRSDPCRTMYICKKCNKDRS